MQRSTKKRFIAGAICPQCQAQDKLMLVLDGENQRRECVACGFADDLDDLGKSDVPATRFQASAQNTDAGSQVLTLEPLAAPGKSDTGSKKGRK